jgi:asparagine synthase (glutamine-hydrolysing)
MEGEFYNQEELKSKYSIRSKTDIEILVNTYDSTGSFDFLRDIDGCYATVLYDKKESKVFLITDRYGFKPLYWGIIQDDLVWSSELKGFLGRVNFKPVIDRQAVENFFDIGYLFENRTWFKGVELVPPASTLIFDLKKSKIRIEHYWSWSEIKSIEGPIDERELVEELGRLFKQSVCRHINSNERVGITLSGGLDSRAILAAVPEDYKPLHTFTFGQEGCEDIKIASKVSRLKGATHHILEINSSNWLVPRISSIWKSDASFSMLHMHGIEFCDEYKSYVDFILDGIWGDVIGGLYIKIAPNKSEEYTAQNRGRRFINQALILVESWLINRRPFTDNKLIDFAFSLPQNMRRNSYIYNKMLLSIFPEYYNNIPWQKTGCPINHQKIVEQLVNFKYRIVNKLKRESQRFGFNFKDPSIYTDYPSWIRQEPATSFFEKVLLSKDALYPEHIDRNKVHAYFKNHIERKANCHNELCLALTFELWLQQLFHGKFRE